jgi:hypothetical protein
MPRYVSTAIFRGEGRAIGRLSAGAGALLSTGCNYLTH